MVLRAVHGMELGEFDPVAKWIRAEQPRPSWDWSGLMDSNIRGPEAVAQRFEVGNFDTKVASGVGIVRVFLANQVELVGSKLIPDQIEPAE